MRSSGSQPVRNSSIELGIDPTHGYGTFLLIQEGLPEGFVPEPPKTPEGLNDLFANEFSEKVRAMTEKLVGDRPRIRGSYSRAASFACISTDICAPSGLKLMGTLPSHRRRGAASLQLAWANELADREGLVCYTEASVEGLPVYEKAGWKAKDVIVSNLLESAGGGTYTSTCVLREPKSTSANSGS